MLTNLRPHQIAGIDRLRAAISAGRRRLVLAAPTGSGKTILSAAVAERASARGNSTWFVVPSIVLAWQAAQSFEREGIACRVMQGDRDEGDADAGVTISTIQTLTRRKLPLPRVVIVDEVHLLHRAHERLMAAVVAHGGVAIGLSATPYGRRVAKVFDEVITPTSVAALTAAGVLAPARVLSLGDLDPSALRIVRGDYDETAMSALYDTDPAVADVVAGWWQHGENRQTVAFAASVAHATRIAAAFKAVGVPAEAIDGSMSAADRDAVLGRLRSGETRIVANCQLLIAGFDHPGLGALIMARATASAAVWMQAVGRVLRSAPGKADGLVLDFGRNAERLGLPVQIGPTGEAIGDLPIRCPCCAIVAPPVALTCDACGHERPPTPRDLARWYGGLLSIAAERNRRREWAAHTFREKFGHWPRGLPDSPEPPSREVRSFVAERLAAWRARQAA